MSNKMSFKKIILNYIKRGEKAKLCILDLFLEKEKLRDYDIRELLVRYYPVKLYNISKIYNELKNDGILIYDPQSVKDKLADREAIAQVFEELKSLIEPLLAKEVWGYGDVIKTLEEHQSYIIQKILIRGGVVSKEIFLSDISRDFFNKSIPLRYSYAKFEDCIKFIESDIVELVSSGYITITPLGYHLPDFVMHDFLRNPIKAVEIFSNLSRNLWMAFEFEPYLSKVRELQSKYDKLARHVFEAVDQFNKNLYNDALDSINVACEELSSIIYKKIFGEEEQSIHARLVKIWKEQHLWKDHPELSEYGKNAAVFLSSAIYIPKWIRDKTSHPLVKPTGDSVRLALASLLIAIDVSRTLKLLE